MFGSSSIKLFEVGGTAVRVHPTFFLLLIWIGAVHFIPGGAREAVTGVVFVVVLFACVVRHEFGTEVMPPVVASAVIKASRVSTPRRTPARRCHWPAPLGAHHRLREETDGITILL
jgi:hypothetical protein